MRRVFLSACALAVLAAPSLAAAPEDIANEVAGRVMSPFCPGVTLHDCPSAQADQLRRRMEDWARAGMGPKEIEDRLVAEFGEGILAAPSPSGFNLLAWLLPAAGLLAAGTLATVLARRWNATRPAPAAVATPSAEDRIRLDEELEHLRGEG